MSLSNDFKQANLKAIKVKLFNTETFIAEFGPFNLAGRQTTAFEQSVRWNTQCSGSDVFYRVTFTKEGLQNDLIVTPTLPVRTSSTIPGFVSQIVVALLALLSAGAGAWITHRFSLKREREKDRLAWRMKTFESLQPAVRDFLNAWGASTVPAMLQNNFAELRRKADVEADIVAEYEAAYKTLSDAGIDNDQKKAAAKKLDAAVRSFLKRSEPYVSS